MTIIHTPDGDTYVEENFWARVSQEIPNLTKTAESCFVSQEHELAEKPHSDVAAGTTNVVFLDEIRKTTIG